MPTSNQYPTDLLPPQPNPAEHLVTFSKIPGQSWLAHTTFRLLTFNTQLAKPPAQVTKHKLSCVLWGSNLPAPAGGITPMVPRFLTPEINHKPSLRNARSPQGPFHTAGLRHLHWLSSGRAAGSSLPGAVIPPQVTEPAHPRAAGTQICRAWICLSAHSSPEATLLITGTTKWVRA